MRTVVCSFVVPTSFHRSFAGPLRWVLALLVSADVGRLLRICSVFGVFPALCDVYGVLRCEYNCTTESFDIPSNMTDETNQKRRVCVVVLGDWGRSPRMQFHALSLAKHGFHVDVVAYKGSLPYEEVSSNAHITEHLMSNIPDFGKYLPKLFVYILKTIWQSLVLFFTLLRIPKPDHLLLQNPPSVPSLPVACCVCKLRNTCLVVDFHNYGYTILKLSLGENHILVKICAWCEKYFGRKAKKNLCVTKAMKEDLKKNWDIRASVFYDCPPQIFHPVTVEEMHSIFLHLSEHHDAFKFRPVSHTQGHDECTRFTCKTDGKVDLLEKRPALIASSTSWTEDEDFSVLLNALEGYEDAASHSSSLPHLICAITGKGPMKAYYEEKIKEKNFTHVEVVTLWLKAEDYPTFLASADLGICLHKSSSGLDLPMKVVDMFGCCLPVCAISYPCIGELVRHGINGVVFQNSSELCDQLKELLTDFPNGSEKLKSFRGNLKNTSGLRWEESWQQSVLPMFN